jgi:MarR family transcriptional regulator, temperature-dependent positive regulator of motility
MFEQCLYFNTTALARLLEKQWAIAFKPFDLTPPQAFMLRVVLEAPGLSPGEVAKTMAIARPTATRALDGLELKGFIHRSVSEHDGREAFVFPTKAALAIEDALKVASASVTKQYKKKLSDELFGETVKNAKAVRALLE